MADTSLVGGRTIPVPAGGTDSQLGDPTLLGLLDHLGFALKEGLDTKLSEMRGPVTSAAITDACPTANRFPWDHGGSFARNTPGENTPPIPALYAWETSSRFMPLTLYWDCLERQIKVQYIFPELQVPSGNSARHGLMSDVARIFAKATERYMRHDSYGYGSDADGTPLFRSIGVLAIRMNEGQYGRLEAIPSGSSAANGRSNAAGTIQRFFPAYEATFTVWERIEPRNAEIPGDVMGDSTLTIAVDAEGDGLDLLERILPPAIAEESD
jgi:hypothetical protein